MGYIPHSEHDIRELLKELKLSNIDELFRTIPLKVCFDKTPYVSPCLEERDIYRHFADLAAKNISASPGTGWSSFLGDGVYNHYVPALVDALSSRGEFLTPYTPYQPELNQGNLQITFEFQSMIANLVGMEVANASVFDGAHALVEALFMAKRLKSGERVLLSEAIHPEYLQVVRTYAKGLFEIDTIPWDPKTGITDLSQVKSKSGTFAIALQHPNTFGCLEEMAAFQQVAAGADLISIVANNEPLTFAALKPPGHYGVGIYAGEGQGFGNLPNYGGPHVGLLATAKKHLRNMPGRLIGRTVDAEGKPGFVMTLTTREQHIRRERATSNICTNQFLVALRTAIYLAHLGANGLQKLAYENAQRMTYLLEKVKATGTLKRHFGAPVFNECVIDLGAPAQQVVQAMEKEQIIAGRPLDHLGLPNCLLTHVSECHTLKQIDSLVAALKQAAQKLR